MASGKSRRCQVGPACKNPALPGGDLCAACEAKFQKMYPDTNEETTNMGKKATSKKNGQAKAAAPAKRAPVVAAPATIDDEPFGGLDMDDDEPVAVEEAEAVDVTDEVPTEAAGDDEPEEEEAAPASGRTAARAARDPKRAAKRVKNAVGRLEKFDWEALGVSGIAGALSILRNAIPQLEARSAPRQTKVSEGDRVQVREKYRGKYADFFAPDDLVGLTVRKLANRTAKCTTAKNTEVLFPVAALEAQP